MLLLKVGNRYVHLLKMFGALFTFASAFFVLASAYDLNVILTQATAFYPYIEIGDIFGLIMAPIGSLFLWLGFLVIGLALYRSDRTIFPIEEDIRDYPDMPPKMPARAPVKKKAPRAKK